MQQSHVSYPDCLLNETVFVEQGSSNPAGPAAGHITPDPWVQRQLLAEATSVTDVIGIINRYRCDQGGVCSGGCNLMFTQRTGAGPLMAAVYEGDRFNGTLRTPGAVDPYNPEEIMVTNHYLIYGYDPRFFCFRLSANIFYLSFSFVCLHTSLPHNILLRSGWLRLMLSEPNIFWYVG